MMTTRTEARLRIGISTRMGDEDEDTKEDGIED